MNDFIAGPASGTRDGGSGLGEGGAPPTVLIVALGAALLIAVTLVGLLLGSGGGDPGPAGGLGLDDEGSATAPDAGRVVLTLHVDGGGSGRVLMEPRGITCTETCKRAFAVGARVSLSPDADPGSSFDGWSDACSGKGRCSLAMDRPREVTVAFESTGAPQCMDGRDNDGDRLVDEADPGCDADATEAPRDRPAPAVASAPDCGDGRDNDGDGLVDAAQDPDCANGGTEAASAAPSRTTAPAQPQSECSDGRDNDGDGLTDRAQDPGCATGSTEGAAPGLSECRDGRDNDGDGLVDRPADPGCDADGTEAGAR